MEEIGRRLKSAREARGISLQVVEEETKIRRKYIEALEAGREADLPGDAYLKGFLRTYGNYLGLDGPALVEEYKSGRSGAEHQGEGHGAARGKERPTAKPAPEVRPEPPAAAKPAEAAAARAAESRPRPLVPPEPALPERPRVERAEAERVQAPATRTGPEPAPGERDRARRPARERRQPSGGAGRGIGLLVVAVVLIGGVAYLGWRIFGGGGAAKPEATPPAPPPVVETKPVETAPPPKLPDPPKVTMTRGTGEDVVFTVPAKEVTVQVDPGGSRVWMQVFVDAKPATEMTVSEPREFKGNKIRIRAGHMLGVSLVVNGQRFEKPLDGKSYNLIFQGQ